MSQPARTARLVEVREPLHSFVDSNRADQTKIASTEELEQRLRINDEISVSQALGSLIRYYGYPYENTADAGRGFRFEGRSKGRRVSARVTDVNIQPGQAYYGSNGWVRDDIEAPNKICLRTKHRRVPLLGRLSVDNIIMDEDGQRFGTAYSRTGFDEEFFTPDPDLNGYLTTIVRASERLLIVTQQ